ncbi:MAG: hypothetical protein SF028_09565 [Candidatus Sumerlaeia bacterium]|nr:hypothetical protein [Candidatus Sumerlaeia bacterium]
MSVLGFFLALVTFGILMQTRSQVADLEERIGRLEPGGAPEPLPPGSLPAVPPEGLDQVDELVRAGNKIAAIKFYRELKNCGLAEAKAYVDRVERGPDGN